jgi:hypothetical protein
MNLKKIGKVFTSKSVGTGPLSYEKKNLPGRGLTKVDKHLSRGTVIDRVINFVHSCEWTRTGNYPLLPGRSVPHPSIRLWQSSDCGCYHKPLTAEDRVHSQALFCGICAARSAPGTEYLGMLGVFHILIISPVRHTHLSSTLYAIGNWRRP